MLNFHAKRASCFGVAYGEKLYKLNPNSTELIIYTNSSLWYFESNSEEFPRKACFMLWGRLRREIVQIVSKFYRINNLYQQFFVIFWIKFWRISTQSVLHIMTCCAGKLYKLNPNSTELSYFQNVQIKLSYNNLTRSMIPDPSLRWYHSEYKLSLPKFIIMPYGKWVRFI